MKRHRWRPTSRRPLPVGASRRRAHRVGLHQAGCRTLTGASATRGRQRLLILILMLIGLSALFLPGHVVTGRLSAVRLIYNASDSAPRGFYAVRQDVIRQGDWLLTRLPAEAARLAAQRRYLPLNVPLLKRVAALPGDHVCARTGRVYVNDQPIAVALTQDRQGRPLTPWTGCRWLADDEVFMLSTHHAASFDSRYFGPIPRTTALGLAVPLWTWGATP
ncbi:S26 family signal peptidase [Alcaligenes phenolicus]